MSEPTMTSADQIDTFLNAVRKRLDEDIFLRHKEEYYFHEIFDVRNKNKPLIVRDFYWDYIFISDTLAHEINKDINCSIHIVEAYDKKFSMPFFDADDNMAYLHIPRDKIDMLSGAIHNVKLTRKSRHKDVIALQRYFRNFIRTRFEQVL